MKIDLSHLPEDQLAIQSRCAHPTGKFVELPERALEQSLVELFELRVRKHPDRVAIGDDSTEWTYGTLNARANRIAWSLLRSRGDVPESVALLFGQGPPAIAAVLGVLKANRWYVPIDSTYPAERIQYLIEDSRAGIVVCDASSRPVLSRLPASEVSILDVSSLDGPSTDENPGIAPSPDATAWIIYTSGSTGRPKGVQQTHRNVVQYVREYTDYLRLSSEDRAVLLFSFGANPASHLTFEMLLNGGSLYSYEVRTRGLSQLARLLDPQGITILKIVPTVYRDFVGMLSEGARYASPRVLMTIGESVYARDVDAYKRHFGRHCVMINRLGSSETGSVLFYFIDHGTEMETNNVPVGYAVGSNEIAILDGEVFDTGGRIGEIAVRSRYLSPGYWRQPDATASSFAPGPEDSSYRIYRMGDVGLQRPDGRVTHMGRTDSQIKIRGFRVEPDEVERTLTRHPAVKDAAVAFHTDSSGDGRLVAYVVPSGRPGPTSGELRRHASRTLPSHMVPSAFVSLDSIPTLPNGKLDRRALKAPDARRPELRTEFRAPRSPVEQRLSGIWREVLGLEEIGVDDDFLELGGDSVKATRIVSRIAADLAIELKPTSVLRALTIAQMADIIVSGQNES